MSGIVSKPPQIHKCAPGWTYSEARPGPPFDSPPGTMLANPPSGYDYPRGTVWQCDCGRTWVSTGPPDNYSPGMVAFRPERRLERRRRSRRRSS